MVWSGYGSVWGGKKRSGVDDDALLIKEKLLVVVGVVVVRILGCRSPLPLVGSEAVVAKISACAVDDWLTAPRLFTCRYRLGGKLKVGRGHSGGRVGLTGLPAPRRGY